MVTPSPQPPHQWGPSGAPSTRIGCRRRSTSANDHSPSAAVAPAQNSTRARDGRGAATPRKIDAVTTTGLLVPRIGVVHGLVHHFSQRVQDSELFLSSRSVNDLSIEGVLEA